MKKSSLILLAVMAFAASPGYHVLSKIKIGGEGGWDYVFVDSGNHRLYVSHTNKTEVVDLESQKKVGEIENTQGVHGIAIASEMDRGFISDGRANQVTIFDINTLKTIGTVATGQNPDAILFDPVSKRVFTFNGRSGDSTAIEAMTGKVVGTVALGGKPEFAQEDGKGHVYANIEDKNEIVEIDASIPKVTKRYSIAPCDSPSGLAIDRAKRRLYSVCDNKIMIVSDPDAGKVLATPKIGAGADGVAFDEGFAFSPNGGDGTVTVVAETAPGKFQPVETVETQKSARTIGVDRKTHRLYMPAAEYGPAPSPEPGSQKGKGRGRPPVLPDSFSVIVVGR